MEMVGVGVVVVEEVAAKPQSATALEERLSELYYVTYTVQLDITNLHTLFARI